ncbi:cell surface protein [Brachyspira aalborgi]|uniref:Cell surface protein n=2 Tax=Brachyspira aalborgi TaxID=29522 RepID=A0A5C8D877_9SPIR|nr:cell surface protein [Brachyspira aalborgi]TXJ20671.1 cell surface protein [Brachyspira aalborgi]
MKKIFLTTIALLSMASATIFGMYGPDSDWIFFLTDGNRFRARADQLGFTLGNDTIKGTFGFRNKGFGGQFGKMLNTTDGVNYNFNPTISMGLGYTSSLISVGVGYNATIGSQRWTKYNGKAEGKKTEAVAHTPVLVLNAMDNAFRMAIPIQVVNLADKRENGDKSRFTAVSLDAQFRYYTGLDFLPQIRLYLRYGNYGYEATEGGTKDKGTFAETFGFDFRLWFGSMVEEVAINPIIKIQYNGALGKQHNQTRIQAADLVSATTTIGSSGYTPTWAKGAWDLKIIPALGITANSDIVSLYVEPSLGFQINQKGSATDNKVKELYSLYYGAYAEIYITPLKNLEWYFEVDLNNGGTTADQSAITFASTTGITWYLPAL